jgi:hypothetical protein
MSEKQNDICTKCSKLLDSEGLCWHCMTREYNQTKAIVEGIEAEGINSYASMVGYKLEIGKLNRIGKQLGYGVYNDMRGKKPKTND